MKVNLHAITPNAEQTMCYVARVSNPANQDNPNYTKLLRYCIQHGHWSVFEHAHLTLEIKTSLAVATQILRHGKGFCFQQFSQRYSDPTDMGFEYIDLRKQAAKNRQSSTEPLPDDVADALQARIHDLQHQTLKLYDDMLEAGVARECARFILPQATSTRLYMTGNVRSWIHYLQLRTQPDTQSEHRQVALAAQAIFVEQLPTIAEALGWEAAA